jgi:hypothetical protein
VSVRGGHVCEKRAFLGGTVGGEHKCEKGLDFTTHHDSWTDFGRGERGGAGVQIHFAFFSSKSDQPISPLSAQ